MEKGRKAKEGKEEKKMGKRKGWVKGGNGMRGKKERERVGLGKGEKDKKKKEDDSGIRRDNGKGRREGEWLKK